MKNLAWKRKLVFLLFFLMFGLIVDTTHSYANNIDWKLENGKWYYYQNQKPVSGWKCIGNKWYFMNSNGVMQTGWVYNNGKWYYLQNSGAMETGWSYISGKWYYLDNNGAMQTGWLSYNGKKYFLNQNGVMQTGWYKAQGKTYYFNGNGAITTGVATIAGKTYYFSGDGVLLTNSLFSTGSKKYFANDSGELQKGWVHYNGFWYFFDSNYSMETGWLHDSGEWYFLNTSGQMQTGWLSLNNNKYYLDSHGVMLTGWFQVNGDWYYSNSNGVMQTGNVLINGKNYFFNANGVWVQVTGAGKLSGKKIVIDPGHGGYDAGASGGGIHEKDITLAVSLKLASILKEQGATVYMTRSTDKYVTLDGRVEFSNSIKPDAFISIHVNSSTSSSADGIETYHNSQDGVMPAESKQLAEYLQDELIKTTGAVSRGIKDESFHVIRGNDAPAVLVEIGFITNSRERANLISDSYQNKICTGLLNGLLGFFGL